METIPLNDWMWWLNMENDKAVKSYDNNFKCDGWLYWGGGKLVKLYNKEKGDN